MQQAVMSYADFVECVKKHKWTMSQVRFDESPPPELVELMDQLGLRRYEMFALRYERESRCEC